VALDELCDRGTQNPFKVVQVLDHPLFTRRLRHAEPVRPPA
jgi:hypothetical protein